MNANKTNPLARIATSKLADLHHAVDAITNAIPHFSTKSTEFETLAQAERYLRDITLEIGRQAVYIRGHK